MHAGHWTAVLVLGILAGCAASPEPGSSFAEPGTFHDDETGAVRGIVTDDQLAPIVDALVTLGTLETRSDLAGAFAFSFVKPGRHLLMVAAVGFESMEREADVTAGAPVELRIQLRALPSVVPYYASFTASGVIACAWGLAVNGDDGYYGTVCGLLPLVGISGVDSFITDFHDVGMLPDVAGLVAETEWDSTQALGDWMFVRWWTLPQPRTTEQGGGLLNVSSSGSPVRLTISVQQLSEATYPSNSEDSACPDLTGCALLATHHSFADKSRPLDATVTIQQRFTDWLTVFHGGDFPGVSFSALQDA